MLLLFYLQLEFADMNTFNITIIMSERKIYFEHVSIVHPFRWSDVVTWRQYACLLTSYADFNMFYGHISIKDEWRMKLNVRDQYSRRNSSSPKDRSSEFKFEALPIGHVSLQFICLCRGIFLPATLIS